MKNLYPTIDEFECPNYKCKDCINFKFCISGKDIGCNHRFDHMKMEYAHPWFVSHPQENGEICSDFEPDSLCKAALPYWHGIEHYIEWKKRQDIEFLENGIMKKKKQLLLKFILTQKNDIM